MDGLDWVDVKSGCGKWKVDWVDVDVESGAVPDLTIFVMYCFITTVPVAFYWARSVETVHYNYNETVIFAVLNVQLRRL